MEGAGESPHQEQSAQVNRHLGRFVRSAGTQRRRKIPILQFEKQSISPRRRLAKVLVRRGKLGSICEFSLSITLSFSAKVFSSSQNPATESLMDFSQPLSSPLSLSAAAAADGDFEWLKECLVSCHFFGLEKVKKCVFYSKHMKYFGG